VLSRTIVGVTASSAGKLLAISDLHVGYEENRQIVAGLAPDSEDDWLLVAGDVAETFEHVEWALRLLADRFARVVWAPGNHELWTPPGDPVQLRGEDRYQALVELCRSLGVLTPEDPYAVWTGQGGPALVAPLFLLYDYTFLPAGYPTRQAALARAYEVGVVCNDEFMLHPDPWPTRQDWCRARLALTEGRLAGRDPSLPTVLVNHYPLIREPTDILRYPEFAQWCGTTATEDWHRRFGAAAMVYGHLHIPRRIWRDGVPFDEVSLGYPREWKARSTPPHGPRQILADRVAAGAALDGAAADSAESA
jgi:3',5'-cyclic AMP phosphodiesterase CpdA